MPTGEQRCVRCCEMLTRQASALDWCPGSTISVTDTGDDRVLQQAARLPISIEGSPDCAPVDLCPSETESPIPLGDFACYPNDCARMRWALDRIRELEHK